MKRRTFLKILAGGTVAVGAGGAGTYAAARSAAFSFGVSRHSLKLLGLKRPLRAVQLSDLHFGKLYTVDYIRQWVDAALEAKPDLLLITGDVLDTWVSEEDFTALIAELSRLRAPLGTWAVVGNHDFFQFWDDVIAKEQHGSEALRARLPRAGVRVLLNEGAFVRDDLYLAGVDDLWMGKPDIAKALRGAPDASRAATILMSHNPDLLPDVPDRVGLTLCGHTHGGQVRTPFGFALVSISKYGERFQQGFVRAHGDHGALGFVSRGLATTGVALRTFCPAELVVLDLLPADQK